MKITHNTNINTIDSSIAVALFSGGHRAAIFGLGVLNLSL
jgi:hypothetical protein